MDEWKTFRDRDMARNYALRWEYERLAPVYDILRRLIEMRNLAQSDVARASIDAYLERVWRAA